ncbi:hypothetical protein L7F22_062026 [Adiantum nelumboides]|nr:hypothetical protein [Adiantum nelumboides]
MAYQLKLPNHWLIHNAFHVSLLKPYKGEPPSEAIMEDPPEVEDQEEVLQPESILRHEDKVKRQKPQSLRKVHSHGALACPASALRQRATFWLDITQGWVVSICLVGGLLGSMWSSNIADNLGRRRAAQLCTVPLIVGGCFSAVARSTTIMLIGRFLVGLGLGIGDSTTTVYVSEISPAQLRGTFGAMCQISGCLGLLGSYVVGLPVATIDGWWRVCFWLSLVPAAILLLGFTFCPESPRWLCKVASSRVSFFFPNVESLM